ncbi:MAG: ribonuclease R [Betaproteobacteria bacterium]|jgi:ribonuclease R|nr:ribonuclease R [Betaproteobacteria bacterium]MDH5343342.1 ribonuclease R [Betaproteobacteria bacterium]
MKKPKKSTPRGKSSRRAADPFQAREAGLYEHPVPSRELILEVLVEAGVPMDEADLFAQLEIGKRERDAFGRRLGAMERDGQIMRNRRGDLCVVEKLDLIRGRVMGHKDGFGFLQRDEDGPDLFLGPSEMQKVLHGDRVMARISGMDRRGRPEGKIVEVLEHGQTRLVGRLHVEHGVTFVTAEDKRISQEFVVPAGETGKARAGQVVTVEIIAQPGRHAQPLARVVEVLGNYADPGMEIEIALRKHALPWIFSPEAEALSAKLPKTVRSADHRGRKDLRDMALVTIDGETARDFDDAVYCEAAGSGFRLVVAIADVSHYVRPGDALDVEARERGNSVYFPRRVIPMLPEPLSNGLCSINPDVERLAMVCDMQIDAQGNVKKYTFCTAVMRSHARFTYTEVAAILEDPKGAEARKRKALVPNLENLYRLYHQLAKARATRGAIDFETIETQMIFNDQGKIENIVPVYRNDAHRIIEECMLAANVCASDFLREHDQPMLFRVHEGPTPEKLEALRDFLKGFGLQLSGGDTPHASDYAKLLSKVKGRPDEQLLQTVMLRSLKQAVYTPKNAGHFGLAYESYTHFTSPIRRYPDLLVHRAIKAVLEGKKYEPGDWQQLGAQCSMTERRADDATRDVTAWLKCYYMRDRVGEVFMGSVAGVAAFGAFVALDDIYVEGLVHISDLGKDYFKYDAGKHELMGERTHQRYRLGDRVRVKIAKVDLNAARIDFVLA